jgi:hypothetical protein
MLVLIPIVYLCFLILLLLCCQNPEPSAGGVSISADVVDNEGVHLSITMTRAGFAPAFPPPENIRVFATVENGENALVEIVWKEKVEIVLEGMKGERMDGEGMYTYGKDPKGKEIEVKMYVDGELIGNWRVVVS